MTTPFKSTYSADEAFCSRADLLRPMFGMWDSEDPVSHAINPPKSCKASKAAFDPPPTSCLQAALDLAAAGYKIFPVPPGTKRSYISKKNKRFGSGENWGQTNDPELIKQYWRRWPRANIGLPTGWVNGIVVIETDTRAGHPNLKQEGEVSLKAAEKRLGKLLKTRMARSPSGSIHRFFAHPGPGLKVTSRNATHLGEGIDIKGDGGMVVAPPSLHKGGAYEWINKLPIAELPETWIKELTIELNASFVDGPSNPFIEYGNELSPVDLDNLADAMRYVPNDDLDWDSWNDIALALFAATGGSEFGFKLFDEFSHQSYKYDRHTTLKRWRLIKGSPPNRTGPNKLFAIAREYGWAEQLQEIAPTYE